MTIRQRIAEVVAAHETFDYHMFTWTCDCGVDFHDADSHAAHVAEAVAESLGLTEFECDGERWWSTKFYPLEDE